MDAAFIFFWVGGARLYKRDEDLYIPIYILVDVC